MQLCIELNNIQHVNSLRLELDLDRNGLTCIVGKNGIGKTTLIKSIRNLKNADTFSKMAQSGTIKANSRISYTYGDEAYNFEYDSQLDDLNSKTVIPAELKRKLEVELPMPWGQRFNSFQSISSADSDIRTAVMLEEYSSPQELIELLSDVYCDDKFSGIKEIKVGRSSYYVIPLGDDRYVREDHLSSGEFFLISLYRKIKGAAKLIVIDEIDISLDAAAQSRLIGWLRRFCEDEQVNIVFTTHSMAIMRTMREDELNYMYVDQGAVVTKPASYNFIKSVLFGFLGWDRYILTEDPMLEGFFRFLINTHNIPSFYSFQIIPVGGGDNVIQLLRKNAREGFFGAEEHVIAILDGDYAGSRNERQQYAHCIPFASIEKKIFEDYQGGKYKLVKQLEVEPAGNKQFRKAIKKFNNVSDQDLYVYLNENYADEISVVCRVLEGFLGRAT
jgi:ABC-type multidrug transport system ATPase subunit